MRAFAPALLIALCAASGLAQAADGPGMASVFTARQGTFGVTLFSPSSRQNFPGGNWFTGDVDGDGDADIVHVTGAPDVGVWLSKGDGSFEVRRFHPGPNYPTRKGEWMSADIDGDKRMDLVHRPDNKNFVMSWLSRGNGTFNVVRAEAGRRVSEDGQWLTGDITGDGAADLVHIVPQRVELWIATGGGNFQVSDAAAPQGYAIPNGHWMMLRGPQKARLVHLVANFDYAHLWLWTGGTQFDIGWFRPWTGYPMPRQQSITIGTVTVPLDLDLNGTWLQADLNGDKNGDIVHLTGSGEANVWLSQGLGFQMGIVPFGRQANGPWLTGDVDGDSFDDLIHPVENSDRIDLWFSTGQGGFAAGSTQVWPGYPVATADAPDHRWRIADFSGDGRADFLHVYRFRKTWPVQVSRHPSVPLSEAEVEHILNDMTGVLLRNDDTGDETCPVRFSLQGPVGTFTEGNGTITTEEDFRRVLALPGQVKVVKDIQWCSLPITAVGCALANVNSIVVVRRDEDDEERSLEGKTWAHEFVHTKGIDHRIDHDPAALMNASVDPVSRAVSPGECRKLK